MSRAQVQFGHAGARARNEEETAGAKTPGEDGDRVRAVDSFCARARPVERLEEPPLQSQPLVKNITLSGMRVNMHSLPKPAWQIEVDHHGGFPAS